MFAARIWKLYDSLGMIKKGLFFITFIHFAAQANCPLFLPFNVAFRGVSIKLRQLTNDDTSRLSYCRHVISKV